MLFRSVAVLLVLSVTDGQALAEEPGQTAAEPFDVLIRGGTLYDGSGSAPVKGDLAIRGDKIITLGNLSAAAAKTIIDAKGLAVAPGFINMLSWSTESLLVDGKTPLRPFPSDSEPFPSTALRSFT